MAVDLNKIANRSSTFPSFFFLLLTPDPKMGKPRRHTGNRTNQSHEKSCWRLWIRSGSNDFKMNKEDDIILYPLHRLPH